MKKKDFNFETLTRSAKPLSNTDLKKVKGGIGDDDIEVGIGGDDIEQGITNTDLLGV